MITLYDCVSVPCPRSACILLAEIIIVGSERSHDALTFP